MRTEAQEPVRSVSFSGVLTAGDHTTGLLRLAHALTHTPRREAAGTHPAGADPVNVPVGVDVGGFSDAQCVGWAQDLEQLLRYGHALATQIAGELGQRYAAGRFADSGARGSAGLLVQALHLSAEEASRRLKLAQLIQPALDPISGAVGPIPHPLLAQAVFTGTLSPDRATTVSRYLQEADRLAANGRISEAEHTSVEHTLIGTAQDHGPDFIRRLGHRVMAHLDPDGQKPSDSDLTAKQGLFFRHPRRGLISFYGNLTIEQHEQLMATIGHATNPHHHDTTDTTGTTDPDSAGDPAGTGAPGPPTDPKTPKTPKTQGVQEGGSGAGNFPTHPTSTTTATGPPDGEDTLPCSKDWGGYLPDQGTLHPGEPGKKSRTVHGIRIPAPGSFETLPGLDPIDPASTDRAVKDTRTYGQKLLDGLISCLKLAARTNTLPSNGGLKPQLILACTQEDLNHAYHNPTTATHPDKNSDKGAGTIFTSYNGPLPIHLFDASLCDPEITRFVYAEGQTIINTGRTQRLFTPAQRKLLFARDLGCTFPDCTAPAPWTEAHHIIPWQAGGPTNLNNAALLCSYHHTLIHNSQWQLTLTHGTPHYTPPWYIDPTQTPRHNNYHHAHTPPTKT